LYQKAAENDNIVAMYNLAICYKNEEGTEMDLEKACYWFQKAAENGNIDAMYNLGTCYEYGEGTEKNSEKAFYWFQKAAKSGDRDAMISSGNRIIDDFLINQVNGTMKFVFYNMFNDIKFVAEGGFSKIHKATWIDVPIALKELNNSINISSKELNEVSSVSFFNYYKF
jgi:hypothetical protein